MDELKEIFNLAPGKQVDFLGLTWTFLRPGENLPSDTLVTPLILCDRSIQADYIAKAYKACEFKIVVSCQRDEEHETRPPRGKMSFADWSKLQKRTYRHKGLKGVVGIIFAKRYLDGVYVSITCANAYENDKIIPTKLGLLLRTAMLNYVSNHFGITKAYNHAANKDLVKYYRKLGWVIGNQSCDIDEPLSVAFKKLDSSNVDAFLDSFEVGLIKTLEGFPMKLCDYDLRKLNDSTARDFMSVKSNITRLLDKYGSLCLPKANFSGYLKDVHDESNNEYNSEYDINQSFADDD